MGKLYKDSKREHQMLPKLAALLVAVWSTLQEAFLITAFSWFTAFIFSVSQSLTFPYMVNLN